jgi:hypothetical protein
MKGIRTLNVSVRFSNADKEGTNTLNIFLPPCAPDLAPPLPIHTSDVSDKGFLRDTVSKPGGKQFLEQKQEKEL